MNIKPTSKKEVIHRLITSQGGSFSARLGIDLSTGREGEVFKWFLASILFGARISESIAINTFKTFSRHQVISPKKILKAGWDGLVQILDEGGYTRYDFKTATKLLDVSERLLKDYGSLQTLHEKATDARDLEERLISLGKGIGEVTVNIFLRELREVWSKAEPLPGDLAILAARNLQLAKASPSQRERILQDLSEVWKETKVKGRSFIDFEASLVRLGKDFCRKRKCSFCKLKSYCQHFI